MTRHITIGLVLVGALAGSAAAQTVLYVDESADQEPHDGSDWCHAYLEVYEALAVAGPDTTIRVADGTYLPDTSGLGDPREATFQLVNEVTIEGGYAGCGADDPDERDIELYETILSGDIGTLGDDSDNSYHVVTGSGTDPTAVLDGFTITAGNADGPRQQDHDSGGGMYNDGGNPTLSNCTFSANSAQQSGGGMRNHDSNPTLSNCTFSGNSAGSYGGGMGNYLHNPMLTNCTFNENSAGWCGGGMGNASSSPTLTNCTFNGNSADWSGGGMLNDFADPTLTNCTFSGNSANDRGGGMYNSLLGSATLTNCTFSGNSAYSGGGMYNWPSYLDPTLTNCILWGNTADYDPQIWGWASVRYSCVQGGYSGAGNIDTDPLFVDPENEDYHLSADSPCIDAADNTAVPADEFDLDGDGDTTEPIPFDLDGNPRFMDDPDTDDTGNPDPDYPDLPIVDMGAYEFQACAGDLDADGDTDHSDLGILLADWGCVGSEPEDCPGDLDGDFDTDHSDLGILLADWGCGT